MKMTVEFHQVGFLNVQLETHPLQSPSERVARLGVICSCKTRGDEILPLFRN